MSKAASKRADMVVVEQGLAPSRARAQALILAGAVIVMGEDRRIDKPGQLLGEATELRLKDQPIPYVSRGGLKLAAALQRYGVSCRGATCLDVGASTGGFTDCLLQNGAAKVYALDVGHNQLAWSIRQDPRVVVIERCNIRLADDSVVPEPCAVIVIDVSFISLRLVLPKVLRFAQPGARLIALVKPQFEVGPQALGKHGVVRDEAARQGALDSIVAEAGSLGLQHIGTMPSPIVGAKGNHEFLLSALMPA